MHDPLRLAIGVGTVHFPRMRFVLAHSLLMPVTTSRMFTVSASGRPPSGPEVEQIFDGVPMPVSLRSRLYPAAPMVLAPRIVRWDPDVINLHFMSLGGFAVRAARLAGAPLVTTVHALEPFLLSLPRTRRQRYLEQQCRSVLAESSHFLPVSNYVAQWLESIGVEGSRITTNIIGVDTSQWTPLSTPETKLAAQRITFIGHLTPLKGILDLLEASIRLYSSRPHRLDIVGDGPLAGPAAEVARRHSHITLHGIRTAGEIQELLKNSTVLALPTRPDRGIADAAPTVLMEAQASGVPCVAIDSGGTREILGATPELLVSGTDVDDLAAAIDKVLSQSTSTYLELSTRVTSWARKELSAERQAARTRSVLTSAV